MNSRSRGSSAPGDRDGNSTTDDDIDTIRKAMCRLNETNDYTAKSYQTDLEVGNVTFSVRRFTITSFSAMLQCNNGNTRKPVGATVNIYFLTAT